MYKITYAKKASKFLKEHNIKDKVEDIFKDLIKSQTLNLTKYDISPLTSFYNCYRLRIGKYRVVFEIKNDILLIYIIMADTRGDIYKKLNKKK